MHVTFYSYGHIDSQPQSKRDLSLPPSLSLLLLHSIQLFTIWRTFHEGQTHSRQFAIAFTYVDWIVIQKCNYLEGPFSPGIFSPSMCGHERPFGESVTRIVIIRPDTKERERESRLESYLHKR